MLVTTTPYIPPGITKCNRCRHMLSMHEFFTHPVTKITYAKCHRGKCMCSAPLLLLYKNKPAIIKNILKYRTISTYPDIRAGRKTPPLWMVINLSSGLCWCGKPKKMWDKYRRKFCNELHAHTWHYHVTPWWPTMRSVILKRDDGKCAVCGHRSWDNEVDHVVPKATNSDLFWDEGNLRVLCEKCHHKKTAGDMRAIAIRKRGARHVLLSSFFQ